MRNRSRNSSGILSRNPSRSEELAFRKAVFDLLKDLETESGASPDSTASMDIRAARAVVSMLFETFFSQERRDRIEKDKHYTRNLNMPVESLPATPEEAEKWGWDDGVAADCHQFTSPDKSNVKYVSPDGRSEAIFTSEGELVTAPEDYGTYNFAVSNEDPIGHFYMDVFPWLIWGNEEADSTTLPLRLRAFVIDGGRNVIKSYIRQEGTWQTGPEPNQEVPRQDAILSRKLYYAIGRNQEKEVRKLLAQGAQIDALRSENPVLKMVDFENIYPIEKACKTSFEMASLLLDEGARADVIDPYIQATPLIFALSANYEKRFALAWRLIESGVKIEQVDANGRTALNKAAILFPTDSAEAGREELELMKYLLDHCDPASIIEQSGTNPLVEAARFDNLPVMEYILDRNLIDINQTSAGYTPLMKAVLANCESAARLLISRGADTGMRSPSGKTASDYAAAHGNEQIKALFS